jgi:energy-coupling factor transporter ATP-binding protein EcfA2
MVKKEGSLEDKVDAPYIAHQVKHPYDMDEMMRLARSYEKKSNLGIYGPPGMGKTLMVKSFAKLISKEIETVQCAPEVSITDITGGNVPGPAKDEHGHIIPVMEMRRKDGPLSRAMKDGKIFYADEWNKLTKEVQSYLSAPLDFRRELKSTDGDTLVEKAKEGFMFIASWNPGEEYGGEEILGFIKDRISYVPFHNLNVDMQTRIGLIEANMLSPEDIRDDKIQTRAIMEDNGKLKFFVQKGDEFINLMKKGEKVSKTDKRLKKYLCYIGKKGDKMQIADKESQEAYDNIYSIADFMTNVREIVINGASESNDDIKNVLATLEASDLGPLHDVYHIEPKSVRAIGDIAKDYQYFLKETDYSPEQIVENISDRLLNEFIQDKGEVEVSGKIKWKDLVKKIAQLYSIELKGEKYQLSKEESFAEI